MKTDLNFIFIIWFAQSLSQTQKSLRPNIITILAGLFILGGIALLIFWLAGPSKPINALFATDTPTPTMTFTPTNTSTPTETPTITPTYTITPLVTSSTPFNYTVQGRRLSCHHC